MPWIPELFSAPSLARVWDDQRRRRLALVPFFAGLMTGETHALLESFGGEPELHHPVRGRVKGAAAFERFALETMTWLADHHATVDEIEFILTPVRGVEEVVLHLDADGGRIALPVAIASDHDEHGVIIEQRMYFSTRPLTGRHAVRPPVLQPMPGVHETGVVGEYQQALAAGDTDAAVAAFEADAYVREPADAASVHRGTAELRALYERYFANGGGIPLEHCAVTDDGRACALEYNLVSWGDTAMSPSAGLGVHVRGESGKLAAARMYDDADPPPVTVAAAGGPGLR